MGEHKLRVVLVGCGVMGARHARVISEDPGCELLTVDLLPERAEALAARYGGRACPRVPAEVDAAVVATPTPSHVGVALPLLQRGLFCLVEKPLAASLEGARQLVGPRCATGHVERFNPAIRAAGPLRPQVLEGRRVAPPSGRGQDDVILDLMIHDLDLWLQWLGPEPLWEHIEATGTVREGSTESARVVLQTTSGQRATLEASRVAEQRERVLHCFEPGRHTVLDLLQGQAQRDGVLLHSPDPRDALTCQWDTFAAAARGERSLSTVADGLRAVELAQRIRQSLVGEA
jgi:UDP-N-acetylglucosamine 3-dehydrogenase